MHHATVVLRELLHSGRCAAHVHQYVGHIQFAGCGEHIFIERAARHIINDMCAKFGNACSCHRSAKGVDRDGKVRGYALHHCNAPLQAPQFFVGIHLISSRSSGIGSNVDDIGSFAHHLLHTRFHSRSGERPTCRIKRIGRGIKNAHYQRMVDNEVAVTQMEGKGNKIHQLCYHFLI